MAAESPTFSSNPDQKRKRGPMSEATKNNIRLAKLGHKHTPEAIEKIKAKSQSMWATPGHKEKMSGIRKEMAKDPVYHQHLVEMGKRGNTIRYSKSP